MEIVFISINQKLIKIIEKVRFNMTKEKISVLLIDDDPDDTLLLNEDLLGSPNNMYTLHSCENLGDGLKFLTMNDIDVILLDLNLPDSMGLDTVTKFKSEFPTLPVIALTGMNDEDFAVKIVQAGAQDYLMKGEVTPVLLNRSIRYSIERQQLQVELEKTRQRELRNQEFSILDQLSQVPKTTITSQIYGLVSLEESSPIYFDGIVKQYGELMDLALEQRAFQMEDKVSSRLRILVDQLGYVKANARDIIEIHKAALKQKNQGVPFVKAEAYIEEGRILLLKLMGNLVMYYRSYYVGSTSLSSISQDNEKEK